MTVSTVIETLLILQKDQCTQEKWKSLLRIQLRCMDPRKAHIQNHGVGGIQTLLNFTLACG